MPRWEGFSLNSVALYHRAHGNVGLANTWASMFPPMGPAAKHWNTGARGKGPGSQNIPLMKAAAEGRVDYLASIARVWAREGIWSREFGADGYLPPTLASMIVGANNGEGNPQDRDIVYEAVAASIALLTLMSRPEKTKFHSIIGPTDYQGTGPHYSQQPTVAHIGSRMLSQPSYVLGGILALALDLPRRNKRYMRNVETLPVIPPRRETRDNYRMPELMLPSIVGATGCKHYDDPSEPETFGLTKRSRVKLRDALKGDQRARTWVVRNLLKIGDQRVRVWHGYKSLTIQHDENERSMTAALGGAAGGMKPDIPACKVVNGDMFSYRPSEYKRLRAHVPKAEWRGDTYYLNGEKTLELKPEFEGVQTIYIEAAKPGGNWFTRMMAKAA